MSEGGRSVSSSWHQHGATWKKRADEEEALKKKASQDKDRLAVQSRKYFIAQAFVAPATEDEESDTMETLASPDRLETSMQDILRQNGFRP